MSELDKLIENYFAPRPKTLTKQMLYEMFDEVLEEKTEEKTENKEARINDIINKLNRHKKNLNIVSNAQKDLSDIYVRFHTAQHRTVNRKEVKNILAGLGYTLEDKKIAQSSVPVTYITKEGDSYRDRIKIVYKFDVKTRIGLTFEHIIAYAITEKVTKKLKLALDLPPKATKKTIIDVLQSPEWKPYWERAIDAKKALEDFFEEKIDSVTVEGGAGGKADLMVITVKGTKVGISLKIALNSANIYVYNKDLGDGTKKAPGTDIDITSPKKKPWWMIGRKKFYEELKKQKLIDKDIKYNPKNTDYAPPDWMILAKEQYKPIYERVVRDLYTDIRKIMIESLQNMSLEELVKIVNDANLGACPINKKRIPLYKLESLEDGSTRIQEVLTCIPNLLAIEENKKTIKDMVYYSKKKQTKKQIDAGAEEEDSVNIIINIPGMVAHAAISINSVKFRSSMLASTKGDLNIKTR
tara:strand:+ start:152 stop:1555 length:1404 start_codon:yes stop_codon:yes gene_type:complete